MNEDVEDRRQRSSTIHSTRATSSASGVSSVVCGGRATLRIKLRRGSGVSSACQPCASSRGPIRGALVAQRADCDCYVQRRYGVLITEVFFRPIAELTQKGFHKSKRAFPPTFKRVNDPPRHWRHRSIRLQVPGFPCARPRMCRLGVWVAALILIEAHILHRTFLDRSNFTQ